MAIIPEGVGQLGYFQISDTTKVPGHVPVGSDGLAIGNAANPVRTNSASGIVATATFTPVAALYGAGDIVGLSQEFAFKYADGVTPVKTGSLIRILSSVIKIDVNAVVSGETSYRLETYSVTQPSGQADNALWDLVTGDLSAYRGPVGLGSPVDVGSCLYVKTGGIDADFNLAPGSSSLWARLITTGTWTAPASPPIRQVFLYGVEI